MSKKDWSGSFSNGGGGGSTVVNVEGGEPVDLDPLKECLATMQECLDQIKILIAANNDTTILTEIESQLMAICDKLLANQETQVEVLAELMALCEKLLGMQESLDLLCEKIEQGNEDSLACLEDIKAELAAILAAIVAHTAILTEIEGNQTGMSCDEPTFVELCGYTPIQCCKAPEEGLEVDAWCQAYNPVFPIGEGDTNTEYSLLVDGAEYPLPNPYTQADVEFVLATTTGTFQILDGFLCRTDGPGRVSWKRCTGGDCEDRICSISCGLATTAQLFVPAAEPACHEALPVRTCFEEPIADDLATLVSQGEEDLNCQREIKDILSAVKVIKPGGIPEADYNSALRWILGRPAAGDPFTLFNANGQVLIEGDNINDFGANAEAAGYQVWDSGESHFICPCPAGGPFKVESAVGTFETDCIPLAEAPDAPEKVEPEDTCAVQTEGCNDDAMLAALENLATQAELQTAKLCVIEQNSNPAAPCSKPVEGLDKEALTLTLAGDVTANYPEGQAIDLQNANAESCGSATSAGGATYDAASDVTVIPIVECDLDEGKEPVVITLAQPVKAVTLQAIKTIKTLSVKTLVPVRENAVTEVTATTFKAEAGLFAVGDSVQLLSAEKAVLGTASIAKVSDTTYAMTDNTVPEADLSKVAFAAKTSEKV